MAAVQHNGSGQHFLRGLHTRNTLGTGILVVLCQQHSQPDVLCPVQQNLPDNFQRHSDVPVEPEEEQAAFQSEECGCFQEERSGVNGKNGQLDERIFQGFFVFCIQS